MIDNDKCTNCGGDRAIHHYQTDQCPVGGREAPVGREQEWKTSTFKAAIQPSIYPGEKTRGHEFIAPNRGDASTGGLTKREYFAAMALSGLLGGDSVMHANYRDVVADAAVDYADYLIKSLNKEAK